MPKLNIPYRSQWDNDARDHDSDCGPTCLAMMMNYRGVSMTPDGVYDYDHLRDKKSNEFTTFTDLANVARANGLKCTYDPPANRSDAFHDLRANVDAGAPMLVLVKYEPWIAATGNIYKYGHFVVVSGYDDANVYMHDPLFGGPWGGRSGRNRGSHFAMSHDLFAAGWGGFSAGENQNWLYITVETKGNAPAPTPIVVPQPQPVIQTETAVSPSSPVSNDIQRRIRALAAYRWTEGPDFANAAEVKLWQDHLGDFGLNYENYVVQSGNTLSALAGRFYGGQHRWPAIKAFNDLQRDGLWLGETLMIPHIGQNGAGEDPVLPSNTLDKAKAFDLDDLVDPDAAAQDYNDFGRNSIGIGVYEEN